MADTISPAPAPSPSAKPVSDITKESLGAAASRDDATVKEFLRGTDGERTGQVERVRLALDTLRGGLAGSKREEKARVARAARDLMDEHLVTVQAELKTKADVHLAALETKITNARAVAVEEERAATDVLSMEGAKLEAREITREVQQGNWLTWAKYAAVAVAAGITAKWVWDHTIGWLWSKAAGDEKDPGFLRNAAGWIVGLGAAALGVLGFSRYGQIGSNLLELGKGVAEGADRGWKKGAGATLARLADIWNGKGAKATAVREKFERGEYRTEEEFYKDLADAIASDKSITNIAWEGGVLHFWHSGKELLFDTPPFFLAVARLFMNRDIETGRETLAIYTEGVVIYAASFGGIAGVMRFIQSGDFSKAFGTVLVESALWPVQVLKKGREAWYLLCTTNGHTTFKEILWAPQYHFHRFMEARGTLFKSQTPERLTALVDDWKFWRGLRRDVHAGGDADLIASLEDKCRAIEQNIADSAMALRQQRSANTLGKLSPDLERLVSEGMNVDDVGRLLGEMQEASGAKLAKLVDEWMDVQRAVREAAAAGNGLQGRAQERAAKLVDEIHETLTTLRAQIAAKEAVDIPESLKPLLSVTDKSELARTLAGGPSAAAGAGTAVPPPLPKGPNAAEAANNAADWTGAMEKAKKTLLAADASAEATAAVEHAVAQCKAMGMGADDAVKLLTESPHVLLVLSKLPAAKVPAIALAFSEHGAPGLQRVSSYLATIVENVDDLARAGKLVSPELLKLIAETDLAPDAFARIAANPAIRKALLESPDAVKAMKDLIWWERTLSVNGVINVAGFALSAVMLGVDIATYVDMRNRLSETISNLERNLTQAGFEAVPGSQHMYRHPRSGMKVNMKLLERDVDSLSTEQFYRMGASGAGTAAAFATLLAPSLAFGPAGLAIMAIELSVQGVLTVAEDERSRDFLLDTPASVLAVIGMSQTVGKSEKDVIDEASSWLWSDIFHSTETNDVHKRELRKKAFAIMFFREVSALAKESPEVAQEIFARQDAASDTDDKEKTHDVTTFLDEENGQFWKTDFERVIKPYLAARLFHRSVDRSVHWNEFRDLKIDTGLNDWENVSPEDTRIALREAAYLYAQHLREQKYRRTQKLHDDLLRTQNGKRASSVADIDTRARDHLSLVAAAHNAEILGGQTVFGTPLSKIPGGASTTVERYLQTLTGSLDKQALLKPTASLADMHAAGAFTVPHPTDATKTIGMADAPGESIREQKGPLVLETVHSLQRRGWEAWEKVKDVATLRAPQHLLPVWYANVTHLEPIRLFGLELQRYPSAAERPAAKAFLAKLKHLSEAYSWAQSMPGGSVAAKRNEDFRTAVDSLEVALRDMKDHIYHLAPVERTKARTEMFAAPGAPRIIFAGGLDISDRASVWIESDGKTTEYKAVDGTDKSYAVPGGTLTCQAQPYMREGKTDYRRTWYFERAPDARGGTELYCYTKFNGAEQPGVRITLPSQATVETRYTNMPDLAAIPFNAGKLYQSTIMDVTYVDASGVEKHLKGKGSELRGNPVFRFADTQQKGKDRDVYWTILEPKNGVRILNCRIDFVDEQKSELYVFKQPEPPKAKPTVEPKKPSFSEKLKLRQEGKDDSSFSSH